MPTYKEGDRWSARDAQFVWDGVEKLLGFYELNRASDAGDVVKFAVMNEDILRGETKQATIWEGDPPADTGFVVDVKYEWLSQEIISAGKEIAYLVRENINTILWAECEDPKPPNIAVIRVDPRPEPQILTTTYEMIEGMALDYASGSGIAWDGTSSGFGIDEPGTWQCGIDFIAESTANNAVILMRATDGTTPSQPIEYGIKTSGDSVSSSLTLVFSLSQADLDAAGGTVALVFQVSTDLGTETINWLSATITASRIGVDNG